MSEEGWTWELAPGAEDDLSTLSPSEQDRILVKLDEIVDSPWRNPPEYGEPLQNSLRRKVRVVMDELTAESDLTESDVADIPAKINERGRERVDDRSE
ncbi:type II toxin-antitoxin system RelE family toxin [Halococcoides cellulosivorans]|uniref:Toxin n=1 Tax=Halococcoides cellulosivorans TaxID=1679096 RepID=A0A2R4WYN6_9EURY|nr:toxin [Halococcoides cellulosivorans]AWB26651.1 toxin [Halococcoides cellulosivorans]